MAECLECGTATVPGEAFCSNCGTKNPAAAKESPAPTGDSADSSSESGSAVAAVSLEPTAEPGKELANEAAGNEDHFVSSDSLGGSPTGEPIQVKHTIKKGDTGGRKATVKQLDPGSV
jgi:hypothetical protein